VPVTVVVGGQFGSEGKGKVAQFLARERRAAAVVRIGGSNSGHTGFTASGECLVLRHLPTAALLSGPLCVLGPGTYIDPDILIEEIAVTGLDPSRLIIDENAMLITRLDRDAEQGSGIRDRIGSTGSGTGASVKRRLDRNFETPRVTDIDELRPFVTKTTARLRDLLSRNQRVIIEGTQGFGLSILHSPYFPYATARDTSAAGAVSEAGLSPLDVDEVVMVLRAHPIRVAGASGPLPKETTWENVAAASGSGAALGEYTSVTRRLRRVAEFDAAVVKLAVANNTPTLIALNHLDYVDASVSEDGRLSHKAMGFLRSVETAIDAEIRLVGVGPTAMVSLERPSARLAS
jgi:adenylosuccinate synthase